jgi:hypothetical protein
MERKTVFGDINMMTLITAVMVIATSGVGLFGQNAVDFEYTISNGTVTITGYTGSAKQVAIPGQIDNLPVTAIGDAAFFAKLLASVTIPDSLKASALNRLTSVTIPANVNVAHFPETLHRFTRMRARQRGHILPVTTAKHGVNSTCSKTRWF